MKPLDYFQEPEAEEERIERSLAVMDQFSLAMQTFETRRKGRV